MFGRQNAVLQSIAAIDIHGALFYDVQCVLESAPPRLVTSRIGRESVYENPQAGDAVTVHLVMGQITKIEPR